MVRSTGGGTGVGHRRHALTRFIGRGVEITELESIVGKVRLVTLVGTPGCGKTRLALELVARRGGATGTQNSNGNGNGNGNGNDDGAGRGTASRRGVQVVELASVTHPPTVGSVVGAALGVDERPGHHIEDTLVEALADDELLIVLDNCEHVAAAAAELADLLLASCPRLRVLATSRTPLGVPGEQRWPVPTLDPVDAVELFLDRVELVVRRPGATAPAQAAAEQICRRLDCLPLAIELAAAWSRVLSLDEIIDELGRPSLLSGGALAHHGRHASMTEAVDWSYDLLSPAQRDLFDRLSVFAGGFDLRAVRAVATPATAGPTTTDDAGHSAQPPETGRSTEKTWKAETIAEGTAREAGGRSADGNHNAEAPERTAAASTNNTADAANTAGTAETNSKAKAPERTAAASTNDAADAPNTAGTAETNRAAEAPERARGAGAATNGTADASGTAEADSKAEAPERARGVGAGTNGTAEASGGAGTNRAAGTGGRGGRAGAVEASGVGGGDGLAEIGALVDHSLVIVDGPPAETARYRMLEPIRQFAEQRLAAAGRADVTRRRHAEHYLALAVQADLGLRTPTWQLALRWFEREEPNLRAALRWARTQPDDVGLRLCSALSQFWVIAGRVNEGWRWTCTLLDRVTPDRRFRSSALSRAGKLAWLQRDHDRADALLQESLDLRRELGDELGAARRQRDLAPLAIVLGDTDEAVALCEQSMAVFREHADARGLGSAMLFLGWALYHDGDPAAAEPLMRDAWAVNQHIHHEAATSLNLLGLAFCAASRGDAPAVRNLLADYVEVGHGFWATGWLWGAFALAVAEDRVHTALRLAGGAEAVAQREGMVLSPQLLPRTRPTVDRLRDQVGHARADRLMARGAGLTVDELMAEALAEPAAESIGADAGVTLSRRERQVAELLVQGLTNGQMAEKLFISKRTVESHVDNIKHKLGVASRRQVIAWLLSEGLDAAS